MKTLYEAIGIAATIIVLISFMMTDERKIRLVNIAGAVVFCIYGYLINSQSTLILNAALIVIHIKHLAKEKQ